MRMHPASKDQECHHTKSEQWEAENPQSELSGTGQCRAPEAFQFMVFLRLSCYLRDRTRDRAERISSQAERVPTNEGFEPGALNRRKSTHIVKLPGTEPIKKGECSPEPEGHKPQDEDILENFFHDSRRLSCADLPSAPT